MSVDNGVAIALFVLAATSLAVGYGFGVKVQQLPFTAEIRYSEQQRQFIKWWVKLALVAGVLLPIALLIQGWEQPFSRIFWGSYLLVVIIQLLSEYLFSRWLVPSVVVPIGFVYTAFRLWQLLNGFTQLSLSFLAMAGLVIVALFWSANLVMLTVMAIPTIYREQKLQK